MNMNPLEAITIEELQKIPVWRFCSTRSHDDAQLIPVKRIPCRDLNGKIVGTQVELANGSKFWAFLGNVDPLNPKLTEHFITISVHDDGQWFHLARYHDYDYEVRGPEQLAEFLGLKVDEVFPISYDIKRFVVTTAVNGLTGKIEQQPKTKLSRAEIIALAVP